MTLTTRIFCSRQYLENTTDVANFCFYCLQMSEKSGVMKENCWTFVLVVVHRIFYSHFIISLKKYDHGS
jgi:hypothetical protein